LVAVAVDVEVHSIHLAKELLVVLVVELLVKQFMVVVLDSSLAGLATLELMDLVLTVVSLQQDKVVLVAVVLVQLVAIRQQHLAVAVTVKHTQSLVHQ
tara:strand:- start:14 stop:307 length:294 start_codon:yes stop_codon:yes gene_type:complete